MDDEMANVWQKSGKTESCHRFDNGSTLTNERTNGLTNSFQDSGSKSHVPNPGNPVDNSDCLCFEVEDPWTYYGIVEPGGALEANHDCPVHFPSEEVGR